MRRPFWVLAAASAVVLLVLFLLGMARVGAGSRLEEARAALDAGELERADEILERGTRGIFLRGGAWAGRAQVAMERGDLEAAEEALARAREAGGGTFGDAPEEDALALVREGRYPEARLLAAYLDETRGRPEARLVLAAARAGLHDLDGAEESLARFDEESGAVLHGALSDEIGRVRGLIDDLRSRGRHDWLLDRDGIPILGYTLDAHTPVRGRFDVASLTGAAPEPGATFGTLTERDLRNRVRLAISTPAQAAADRALGRYPGGFVVIDVESGELLAAVSHAPAPRDGEEAGATRPPYDVPAPDGLPWTAFRRHYEGGSVVKLVTLAAAWRNQVDPEGLFPMRCRGNDFILDGKILYDWKPGGHGEVRDVVHAMAVSCNTAFGRMGLRVGPGLLRDELRRWGFGSPLPGDLVPIERGTVWEEPLQSDWETARAGIGLDAVTMTPVQAALMAAAIAGDGSIPTPRLILDRRSIYSDASYAEPAGAGSTPLLDPEMVLHLRESMRAAVTLPDGTGARLRVGWTSVGVKTGTSGDRLHGYDAIVIGYLPAEQPRIAFGMIAEGAGFAGLEGIGVIQRFLDAWRREGGELVRRLEGP